MGNQGEVKANTFFKHPMLPIQLSNCAALLHCWLKWLITHHSLGDSQLCALSLKRPLAELCCKSWGRKELRRSGLKDELCVNPLWFVQNSLSLLTFTHCPWAKPVTLSFSTTQDALIFHQAHCQGSLSIAFGICLGRPVINSNSASLWPSHEALSPFQGLDRSGFSISQLSPLFESPTTNQMCPERPHMQAGS